jgi:hypothetical protein
MLKKWYKISSIYLKDYIPIDSICRPIKAKQELCEGQKYSKNPSSLKKSHSKTKLMKYL